jgi:hypothetical protein
MNPHRQDHRKLLKEQINARQPRFLTGNPWNKPVEYFIIQGGVSRHDR